MLIGNRKNLIKKVTLLLLFAVFFNFSYARSIIKDLDLRHYWGFEGGYVNLGLTGNTNQEILAQNVEKINKHGVIWGLFGGILLSDSAAIEFGYSIISKIGSKLPLSDERVGGVNFKGQNFYLDVMAFWPLDLNTEFLGFIGGSNSVIKKNFPMDSASAILKQRKFGLRYGVGLQTQLEQNLLLRGRVGLNSVGKNGDQFQVRQDILRRILFASLALVFIY